MLKKGVYYIDAGNIDASGADTESELSLQLACRSFTRGAVIMGLKDWLYPPHCPGCGTSVHTAGDWCADCYAVLWHPRMISGSRKDCLDGCYALGDYRGPLRRSLIALKFNGKLHHVEGFRRLLEKFPWPERWRDITSVIGVPVSSQRRKERGFDQTEEIYRDFLFREELVGEMDYTRSGTLYHNQGCIEWSA